MKNKKSCCCPKTIYRAVTAFLFRSKERGGFGYQNMLSYLALHLCGFCAFNGAELTACAVDEMSVKNTLNSL